MRTKPFKMKVVESMKSQAIDARFARIGRVRTKPSAGEIVRQFKRSPGKQDILLHFPNADELAPWIKQVASFTVRKKTGDARRLDLWDCDHLDFFTDMQRSVNTDGAWFSHSGFTNLGSAETATGRINCAFNARVSGKYACVVKLMSHPPGGLSTVECLIDSSSFGPLSFTGQRVQPHFSILSRGNHHFRIRQVQGAFFFLSLTIFRFV